MTPAGRPQAPTSLTPQRAFPVWSFEGYSPDEVVGVRFDKESYTIFIAESLPDGDRDSLLAELGGAKY